MPADTSLAGLGPVVDELAAELLPAALRRVLAGDRGEPPSARPFASRSIRLDMGRPAPIVGARLTG